MLIPRLFVCLAVLAAAALSLSDAVAEEQNTGDNSAAPAFSLQLVPFKTREDADHWIEDLTSRGYRPYLRQSSDKQGRQWYAVCIADYPTAEEARRALAEFKRHENLTAFVTPSGTIFPAGDKGVALGRARLDPASSSSPPLPADLTELRTQLEVLQQKIIELEKEAEARKMLRMTEEEERQREEEILTAVGREYTLIPKNHLGFEYGLRYDYFSSDILEDLRTSKGGRLSVERRGNHVLTNQLFTEYGFLNNLSLNFVLPFVYKYDKIGSDEERRVTDLGDIGMSVQYQPFKVSSAWPDVIVVVNGTFPTGRSPYKINPDEDLATGNGYYAAGAGLTFSKTLDPVVAFGSISYNHPFKTSSPDQNQRDGRVLDEVEAGDTIGLSLGMAFALSYRTSLNLSYQYAYHRETRYIFTDATHFDSNSWVTSSLNIGAGWRVSPRFSLYTRVDIGLTNDDPDFTFSIRVPVRFDLGD